MASSEALRRETPSANETDRILTIERVFKAPKALVFKAFTDPAHLVRWWGPRGFSTPFCKIDGRAGGAWRTHMLSPEGKSHWVQGTYHEFSPSDRLVFSWAWDNAEGRPGHETIISIELTEKSGATIMRMIQRLFETTADRDGHNQGWSSSFDCLDNWLAEQEA